MRRATVDVDLERKLVSERMRVARQTDIELCVAAQTAAAARRELGSIAHLLLRRRAYRRLGFVRLSDYARERLGVSARTVQAAAWLAKRLDALPAVGTAFDRSDISWTQARAICSVASAADECHWLDLAARHSVEDLERFVRTARAASDACPAHDRDPDADADENVIDGEPALRLRLACPARIRGLWRWAIELASRMAGEPLSDWRGAEVIAAEGFSGRPDVAEVGERSLVACVRLPHGKRRSTGDAHTGGGAVGEVTPPFDVSSMPSDVAAAAAEPLVRVPDSAPHDAGNADPFALDTRLVDAMRVIRTSEPRIGHLLQIVVSHRFYRLLGFRSVEVYVRKRLGISVRKAWALLKLEKATRGKAAFGRAYFEGELSWARALALLAVVDHENADAWVTRAQTVTVRRLGDEVNAVLQARDILGTDVRLDPPPLDAPLTSLAAFAKYDRGARGPSGARSVQIGAHAEPVAAAERVAAAAERVAAELDRDRRAASEFCDVEVRFTGPASVVALFRDVLDAFQRPSAARWTALEALLLHVIDSWEGAPRHRDPIFARDGWRCVVPACSSRRNLHDHHLQFRSRGGTNALWNRSSACVAHHLHGLHTGVVRASGRAPDAIHWELGVRVDAPPLLAYVGDRLCASSSMPEASSMPNARPVALGR